MSLSAVLPLRSWATTPARRTASTPDSRSSLPVSPLLFAMAINNASTAKKESLSDLDSVSAACMIRASSISTCIWSAPPPVTDGIAASPLSRPERSAPRSPPARPIRLRAITLSSARIVDRTCSAVSFWWSAASASFCAAIIVLRTSAVNLSVCITQHSFISWRHLLEFTSLVAATRPRVPLGMRSGQEALWPSRCWQHSTHRPGRSQAR